MLFLQRTEERIPARRRSVWIAWWAYGASRSFAYWLRADSPIKLWLPRAPQSLVSTVPSSRSSIPDRRSSTSHLPLTHPSIHVIRTMLTHLQDLPHRPRPSPPPHSPRSIAHPRRGILPAYPLRRDLRPRPPRRDRRLRPLRRAESTSGWLGGRAGGDGGAGVGCYASLGSYACVGSYAWPGRRRRDWETYWSWRGS